jgi:MraZ protein
VSLTDFYGSSSLSLDSKGRLTVPVKHREVLLQMAQGQFILTKHPDRCLIMCPKPNWETFQAQVLALKNDALGWKRMLLGFANEVEIDGASRVLVDKLLREFAGLNQEREVLMLGLGGHFEIWDSVRHAEHEAATLASPKPDSIRDSSFL